MRKFSRVTKNQKTADGMFKQLLISVIICLYYRQVYLCLELSAILCQRRTVTGDLLTAADDSTVQDILRWGCWYLSRVTVCDFDLDLDPMTFIYERDQYSLKIYRMCENELPTSRLSKVIVWQTCRQTRPNYTPRCFAGGQKQMSKMSLKNQCCE